METLQSLFKIVTESVFLVSASFFAAFFSFPIRPQQSVRRTIRLLKENQLSTVALVAFSFAIFAVALGASGKEILKFEGALPDGLQKIWQLEQRQVEALYLYLFVFGSTVLTILGANLIGAILVMNKNKLLGGGKGERTHFLEISYVFVSFTVLWFVVVAVVTAYFFRLLGAEPLLDKLQIRIFLRYFLTKIGVSDISEMFVSPALYVVWVMAIYFGYRMIRHWSLRQDFLEIINGRQPQQVVRKSTIVLCMAVATGAVIVIPGLYLALLSASLFKHATPRVPENAFAFNAACFLSASKMQISLVVTNNTNESVPIDQLYISFPMSNNALSIDQMDLFWMSRKGLYFDPSEKRFYRLQVDSLPQVRAVDHCEATNRRPGASTVTSAKVTGGDAYSSVASNNETK